MKLCHFYLMASVGRGGGWRGRLGKINYVTCCRQGHLPCFDLIISSFSVTKATNKIDHIRQPSIA